MAAEDKARSQKSAQQKSFEQEKLVLTGKDIMQMGVEAELLVGGKNYNTAIISEIDNLRAPQFRAISAKAFHRILDECRVNAALIRTVVDQEYEKVDWGGAAANNDPDFLKNFVRSTAKRVREMQARSGE
ncbi:MAG: PEP/pyruvate-binding domain-containing protein, partial [Desulfohalobiaceae bacterium]